jgi:tRNA modification GTPase
MKETIAAISTPPGEGGIGIVRISGPDAEGILAEIFRRGGGSEKMSSFAARRVYYGKILRTSDESGKPIDEVLAFLMKAPHSYTGEDVVEIQCHGGPQPVMQILEEVLRMGARSAQPGEFTKRAFLSGRIDLVQAGAVIDLIRAGTERSYEAARRQADGLLSRRLGVTREILLSVLAELTAMIDYPEEYEEQSAEEPACGTAAEGSGKLRGSVPASVVSMAEKVKIAKGETDKLLATADEGRLIREGLRVAVIGKPNVGKSSLFNALLQEEAAIVTPSAGTTRDAIEALAQVRGLKVILTDTAGIRNPESEIEALGVERSVDRAERADLILFVIDGSEGLTAGDREAAVRAMDEGREERRAEGSRAYATGGEVRYCDDDARGKTEDEREHASRGAGGKVIVVLNKKDKGLVIKKEEALEMIPEAMSVISASALTGEGLDELAEAMEKSVFTGLVQAEDVPLVTRARIRELLRTAAGELAEAILSLEAGDPPEFAEVNIGEAYGLLGEITGETVTDEVLDRVFSEFCVGK